MIDCRAASAANGPNIARGSLPAGFSDHEAADEALRASRALLA